jgi:hypothetical protein
VLHPASRTVAVASPSALASLQRTFTSYEQAAEATEIKAGADRLQCPKVAESTSRLFV